MEVNEFVDIFEHWATGWVEGLGLQPWAVQFITLVIDSSLLIIGALIGAWLSRKVFLRIIKGIISRSKNTYDDYLLEHRVFDQLAYIVPVYIVKLLAPRVFIYFPQMGVFVERLATIIIIVILMVAVSRFLRAMGDLGSQLSWLKDKPVRSFVQVFNIVNYVIGGIVVVSFLIGTKPLNILGAFGALTAVLLLVFKDTILGLVASIQISANDMVKIGDWVSMDKYGADGDVTEINLTTVKVRNWDKTITTVPTYAFISDSFKNWRGMQSIGARRIKRSLMIDINTIRFLDSDLKANLSRVYFLREYIENRQQEIDEHNSSLDFDREILINGRNMTNLGVFRQYALTYLKNHPKVHQGETIMVRQLQPTEHGIPLEIYCFSNDIAWVNYENIQSDIFDHLLASIKQFDLRVFQDPSGYDFRSALRS